MSHLEQLAEELAQITARYLGGYGFHAQWAKRQFLEKMKTEESTVNLINTTPHDVTYMPTEGEPRTFLSNPALQLRATETVCEGTTIGDIPVRDVFYALPALPPRVEGTYYIVSSLLLDVLAANSSSRGDFIAPHEPVRDGTGRIIGCRAFRRM